MKGSVCFNLDIGPILFEVFADIGSPHTYAVRSSLAGTSNHYDPPNSVRCALESVSLVPTVSGRLADPMQAMIVAGGWLDQPGGDKGIPEGIFVK